MKWIITAALSLLPLAAWATARQDAPDALPEGQGGFVPLAELPPQLPEPSFLESIGILDMGNTRGERNNNPGNIRLSASPWQGKVQGNDAAFETFADPQAGIRALAKLLKNYQAIHGLRTVRQIVTRWAPNTENNTAAYVAAVASDMGVSADSPLDLNNADTLARLTRAIIRHENGRVIYSMSAIQSAVELA